MTEPEKRSYRFDASKRIKREKDFKLVYQFRARVFNRLFAICCRPTAPDKPARLGLSVSKKVGKAFVRNRWKRLIREAFRLEFYELPQGFDYIVIPARNDPTPNYQEVAAGLRELTRKAARRAAKLARERELALAKTNETSAVRVDTTTPSTIADDHADASD